MTIETQTGQVVTIRTREVGQKFGVVGEVVSRNGRVLATTETYPYGFDNQAHLAAVKLAVAYGQVR